MTLRLGLTLPSFRPEPGPVLAVAAAAEAAGLDGIFAFDHLFRQRGDAVDAEPRPALELTTTLAAVAAETARITVGSLVARATLRPPATLVAALDTIARIAPGRLVAGLGSGDEESDPENEAFGVDTTDRLARLEETVDRAVGRGYPVWVGGWAPAARRLAALRADGWNGWGG
ncbi:MAG: LLM class flavin-dependent oxidoreductase, partial [Acidimicrobiia bacterium]